MKIFKKNSYLFIVFIIPVILLFQQNIGMGNESSFPLNLDCVGLIVDEKDLILGTGFITSEKKYIITCAHVLTNKEILKKSKSNSKKIGSKIPFEELLPKLFYVSAGNKLKASIELKSIDVLSDLAFFTTSEKIPAGPLHLGNFDNIKPGDTIIYIGWDKNKTALMIHKATVNSICSSLSLYIGKAPVDCLKFYGEAISGCSGGPVFDTKGNVIAIVSKAYYQRGINAKEERLLNQAFSIEPLKQKIDPITTNIIE